MHQPSPESSPKFQPAKFQSKLLLTCSIANILLFPLCVGLEVWRWRWLEVDNPIDGQGIWGSITFIVAGLLGFSASYKPKKPLIISILVFSALSICFAVISASLTMSASSFKECSYIQNPTICNVGGYCTSSSYSECHFRVNPVLLAIANIISLINNIVVTVTLSRILCKCCTASVVSSIPIVAVHNPPGNPQQPTPMWATSSTPGQFQSHPTAVYSAMQQQQTFLMGQQGQQQQWENQHPSAPIRTLPRDIAEPTTSSPPPYSTLPRDFMSLE